MNDEGVGIRKSMGSRSTVKDKTSAASAMEANHNVRGKTMAGWFGPFPAALICPWVNKRNSGQRHERSQGYPIQVYYLRD